MIKAEVDAYTVVSEDDYLSHVEIPIEKRIWYLY